ncbi:P-loop containing nucleoside triphosphate hydrolase protein [Mycena galopus ATCC 62051]|nr:P-loop containing nucleoside triphosphate hydrolase protein [Mycena galopus ATCC 62051]
MPPRRFTTEIRLNEIAKSLDAAAETLEIVHQCFKTPFLDTVCDTTRSIAQYGETVEQNKADCVWLMEQVHGLLNGIIVAPKIFNGREVELAAILDLFAGGSPRVAILGGGGMGKTSLARAVIHHTAISSHFMEHRFLVACDLVTTTTELVDLVRGQLGLQPGKNQIGQVVRQLSSGPTCLLVFDNLETLWEPADSRREIEEFLSLLSEVDHLALIITMRGAERPAKIKWTRPFLPPLEPLSQAASRQTFFDIADTKHNLEEVDQVLAIADNMPLAINLLAHLVLTEGCSQVIASLERETTSVVSEGFDKRTNLAASISLSLSSPRIMSFPQSLDLLSILSLLPDGISDAELLRIKVPIPKIMECKTALLRASLAYTDDRKRLKSLVPIREYIKKVKPPTDEMIHLLLGQVKVLLETHRELGHRSWAQKRSPGFEE